MSEQRFRRILGIGANLVILTALGTGTLIGCDSSGPVDLGAGDEVDLELAQEISLREADVRVAPEGIDVRRDVVVNRIDVDDLGMAHARMQQTYRGVRVWGGEAIVHLNRDGSFFAMTDDLLRNVGTNARTAKVLEVKPAFEPIEAIDRVLGEYECVSCLTEKPEADLFVYRDGRKDRLVYRVSLHREDGTDRTSMPVIFIDAHTGEKVWEYDNLQTGTGVTLYSGTQTIPSYQSGSSWYLEDTTKKIGTFHHNGTTSTVYHASDSNNVWDTATPTKSAQKPMADAHYGAVKVYDYFKNVHGRDGIDGSGGPGNVTGKSGSKMITSVVHYSTNYVNAFWNGTRMTYGDGDGTTAGPLVTLDICGHEMTHGITERTAGLVYSNQSGALNEAISDIFGAMVEKYARGTENANMWKIGEDCWTPATSGDALRYMDNPHLATNNGYTTDDDPDHYTERYTGTGDNGGVHINSGIVNKWFYLLAKGGSHHLGGSMTGIGADPAADIVYRALTMYMTSTTNFCGARTATLAVADAIHGSGSTQSTAVGAAWDLVGVTATVCGGGSSCCASPHNELTSGAALSSGCTSCTTTVCASDSYCCTTSWDSQCVSEAQSWCGLTSCN